MEALIPLHTIRNDGEYDQAVDVLNRLLDDGAGDEQHPMAELVTSLGELIAAYDDLHYSAQAVSPSSMLRFLMEQHSLADSQLPEIGSAGIVRGVLNGSVSLTTKQIVALSQRFELSASVFR